jgi:hypothetical protein
MPRMLPAFKGYTVDRRLRQFRKLRYGEMPEYIDFDSGPGKVLLSEYRAQCQVEKMTEVRHGFFMCVCGNTSQEDGFETCDETGEPVMPIGEVWDRLRVCQRCDRIMDGYTLEVVGKRQRKAIAAKSE